MGGGACQSYKLTVEIQDNGIIRDPFGWIMGHCSSEWLQRMLNRPPYGLTVSEDGNLINWCGRNYVPQNNKEDRA